MSAKRRVAALAVLVVLTVSSAACDNPVNGPPMPWMVEEDFSSYTSTEQLLRNPRAIWLQGGWTYPQNMPPPDLAATPIALDATKGYTAGGLTQSMRYDFPPFNGGRAPNYDYSIRLGAIRLPRDVVSGELWVEVVAMFDTNFNTWGGDSTYGADYKFIFVNTINDRVELKVGTYGSGRHFSVNYPGGVADRRMFEVPDFGGNNRGVWDGQWHTYRIYAKATAQNGALRVWVDGVKYLDLAGLRYRQTTQHAIMPGNNNNQGPAGAASVWWGRIRAWNTERGW